MNTGTIDITGGLLRINHQPILIRGVNLHEHDPMRGHLVSPELLEADVKLMKRNNFNAVRTSHYPQSPWFYELCNVSTIITLLGTIITLLGTYNILHHTYMTL